MTIKSLLWVSLFSANLISCSPPNPSQGITAVSESPYFLETDSSINVDGVSIRYRDEGQKTAPAIVMVHGFTSSLETWDAVANELKSVYRIIRLDLPGHGLSGKDVTGDYSNARTVDIFSQFLTRLNLQGPTVVGNSLGGLVAWRAAAENSSLIANLVLISPGGFSINGVTEKPVDVPVMVKLYLTKAPTTGIKQATSALYGDPSKLSEKRLKEIEDMMKQAGNGDALVARAAQFTLPAPELDLAKVTVPTLIIWGDKDIMVPPAQGSQFESIMPNAILKSYAGIGHVPQEEAPERLAKDIKDFLTDKATQ